MIFSFILYLLFSYFYLPYKAFNLCSITLLYILIGILLGQETIAYSSLWVRGNDLRYIDKSIFFLKSAYFSILCSFIFFQTHTRVSREKNKKRHALEKLISCNIPWWIIILLLIPLYLVYFKIYFPVFQDKTFISKYFQDKLVDFLPFRPFYTLSINGLSTLLFLQINHFIYNYKKLSLFKLLKNKNLIKLLIISLSLFLSAKRGQLFFPIFISVVSYFMYRGKYINLGIYSTAMILVVAISRNFKNLIEGKFSYDYIIMTLSNSFFVSLRELNRALTAFIDGQHEFLLGKTYLAGFFSFIPTEINALKAQFNYMRYTSIISNQDPDLFGGMRSTFIGEAYMNFGYLGIIIISIIFSFIIFNLHKLIVNYSPNNFVYYTSLLWIFKLVIGPFYENGSSMFLFFLITLFFMAIPSLQLIQRENKIFLRILFLNK